MRKGAARPFGRAGYDVRGWGWARSTGSHKAAMGDLFDMNRQQQSSSHKVSAQRRRADTTLQPASRTA